MAFVSYYRNKAHCIFEVIQNRKVLKYRDVCFMEMLIAELKYASVLLQHDKPMITLYSLLLLYYYFSYFV